ncbi:hybrid sensor histidine kinase/response regulator [Nostoc sp. ChiVER01]|uniref:hybrid sensor histidine kinase/response regulator n=1 Tax=Nostoc sp. ChiVER01 TaxID=3075382 RepID=UPI002AD52C4C|nr:ATP-binding protein [Nostoc sp. ChiVER01]MDZ8225083.1 ATP-binding protein [Nostoc sp. ChiVER01]
MKFWNQHLTTKVASSFLLLSLVSVAVVGGVAFIKAREALKQAAFDRLNVTATLKEEEITRWFEDQQRDFLLATQSTDVQAHLKILLTSEKSNANYQAAYTVVSKYLIRVVRLKPNLKEIFILDRSNRIILCTDKKREGQYEILGNITYIEQVEPGDAFNPNFYVSPLTGKPSVTLATSLRNTAGVRQGVILAHLNLDRIDNIVRERTGLGKSGETYLVGSLITKNTFISKPQVNTQDFPEGISSQGIDEAMSGVRGFGLYRNYAGVPVIGMYRWLNDQDLSLLVEMHQEEAFAPARQLAATIVLVGLVCVGGLLIGVSWLTRQLKISREQLENYSYQLEVKAQEAETANRTKSEFLANMSHELRTPLNSILGFTQLITRDRSINPSHLEHLEIISRSGEHLLTLINDVLSMSKIEAGRTTLNENSFDLYSLLDSLQEMLQIKAESKGLQLIFERSPKVPQFVHTDESKLRQVLINLLGNAIKFTQFGGVSLRVREKTENLETSNPQLSIFSHLHFEIEDTGLGIAPDELDNLFKPFVQTEAGRISQQGTGLGLTISQQFVRLMGGNITVSSTLGQGTIFAFEIKISPAEITEVQTRQLYQRVIGLEANQPKYRILVVEDKWENRQLLVKMLASLGFEVREAENGKQGVSIWETWEPHLIWMDMRMPVMDGYEATKQIKAHLKGQATVIIALTASAFDEERTVILSTGCNDFVRKPFREEVILKKMAKYLGVRYVYEQEAPKQVQLAESSDLELFSLEKELAKMPSEWIAQLHQAALRTDEKLIFSLIEQIPEESAPLTNALTDWVNNFRIDKVIDLTQPEQNG